MYTSRFSICASTFRSIIFKSYILPAFRWTNTKVPLRSSMGYRHCTRKNSHRFSNRFVTANATHRVYKGEKPACKSLVYKCSSQGRGEDTLALHGGRGAEGGGQKACDPGLESSTWNTPSVYLRHFEFAQAWDACASSWFWNAGLAPEAALDWQSPLCLELCAGFVECVLSDFIGFLSGWNVRIYCYVSWFSVQRNTPYGLVIRWCEPYSQPWDQPWDKPFG